MNQQQPISVSQWSDVSLANFPFLSEGAISALSHKLELAMKDFGLRLCQNYYRSQVRDPFLVELLLIDSIAKSRRECPDAMLLSEFTTASDAIAETFADMMTRRTASQRRKNRPLSFDTVASLMEAWLALHDPQKTAAPEIRVSFTPYRDLLLAAEGFQRVAGSGTEEQDVSIGIRPRKYRHTDHRPKAGDYVYAVLADAEKPLPTAILSEIISSPSMASNIERLAVLQDEALFPFLTKMNVGMTLCTDNILSYEGDLLSALTRSVGGIVFIAPPEYSADLLLEMQAANLQVRLLAKINTEDAICFPVENGTAKIHLSFLHSLNFSRLCSPTVEIPCNGEANVSLARLGLCHPNGVPTAMIKVDASGDASFRAALNSVIYAMSMAVALGGSVTTTKLASYLSLPSDRTGEALGAILGLYRGQAEFALRGNAPILSMGKNRPTRLSVVTLAPLAPFATETLPLFATGSGTNIYYLEPLFTEDGLPDFADLKKMYAYVGALIKDKKALAIHPTSEDLLSDLSAMSRDVTAEYLAESPISSKFGGFLIETNEEIEGILVAKIEKSGESEVDS